MSPIEQVACQFDLTSLPCEHPGWHVYAVAVWILGPLSRAAARKIGGLQTIPYQIHIGSGAGDDLTPGTSQTQGIFVQLRQDNLNLAILEIGRPQVEEGSAIVWPTAGRTSRSRRDGRLPCHVREWMEVRSGAVCIAVTWINPPIWDTPKSQIVGQTYPHYVSGNQITMKLALECWRDTGYWYHIFRPIHLLQHMRLLYIYIIDIYKYVFRIF